MKTVRLNNGYGYFLLGVPDKFLVHSDIWSEYEFIDDNHLINSSRVFTLREFENIFANEVDIVKDTEGNIIYQAL